MPLTTSRHLEAQFTGNAFLQYHQNSDSLKIYVIFPFPCLVFVCFLEVLFGF